MFDVVVGLVFSLHYGFKILLQHKHNIIAPHTFTTTFGPVDARDREAFLGGMQACFTNQIPAHDCPTRFEMILRMKATKAYSLIG